MRSGRCSVEGQQGTTRFQLVPWQASQHDFAFYFKVLAVIVAKLSLWVSKEDAHQDSCTAWPSMFLYYNNCHHRAEGCSSFLVCSACIGTAVNNLQPRFSTSSLHMANTKMLCMTYIRTRAYLHDESVTQNSLRAVASPMFLHPNCAESTKFACSWDCWTITWSGNVTSIF